MAAMGALAGDAFWVSLQDAAPRSKILLPAGAVAGIDALAAARLGGLDKVRYSSRKPPASLSGKLPSDRERVVFEGNARDAALQFPKNANVPPTIPLPAIGFQKPQIRNIPNPPPTHNIN